jgi:hypothetical protein
MLEQASASQQDVASLSFYTSYAGGFYRSFLHFSPTFLQFIEQDKALFAACLVIYR